LCMTSC